MGRPAVQWSDARLDQLAAALQPIPVELAALSATVKHLNEMTVRMAPVPAQLAVLATSVDRLAAENRALREELAATQRQLLQIAWGLVAALIGAAAALITALV